MHDHSSPRVAGPPKLPTMPSYHHHSHHQCVICVIYVECGQRSPCLTAMLTRHVFCLFQTRMMNQKNLKVSPSSGAMQMIYSSSTDCLLQVRLQRLFLFIPAISNAGLNSQRNQEMQNCQSSIGNKGLVWNMYATKYFRCISPEVGKPLALVISKDFCFVLLVPDMLHCKMMELCYSSVEMCKDLQHMNITCRLVQDYDVQHFFFFFWTCAQPYIIWPVLASCLSSCQL